MQAFNILDCKQDKIFKTENNNTFLFKFHN
jgi:hypothetical protein